MGPDAMHPTGNLCVALPEIGADGVCRSIAVVSEAERGVVASTGELIAPRITVDGVELRPQWVWERAAHWLPVGVSGDAALRYLVPERERGVAVRLTYANSGSVAQHVELRFTGAAQSTAVHRLGVTTPAQGALAIAWVGGAEWERSHAAIVRPGDTLTLDLFIGVAVAPANAAEAAARLHQRGFDRLWAETVGWLDSRALRSGDPALDERLNLNLFFNYFFAQADCIDTGKPVMLASRSPRYELSGAFWSRDAYWWSFPAILLADPERARQVLVSSIASAGPNIAHHALYVTGERLIPGFELDQLTAPLIALWRYVDLTGDRSILTEPAIVGLQRHAVTEFADWRDITGLYRTALLPNDVPTDYPLVTTINATVAIAFRILAGFSEDTALAATFLAEHDNIWLAMRRLLVAEFDGAARWSWAMDDAGHHELRENPPLGLRTMTYWGAWSDEIVSATNAWITRGNAYHYEGVYAGSGTAGHPAPTAVDLGNRLLSRNTDDGDPLREFVDAPLDTGIACVSWDADSGAVLSGPAMASGAGYLAWTAWANVTGHRFWMHRLVRRLS